MAAAPDDPVAEGKRAFDAGHYGEAARLFEKARESSPRCDIPFYLGLARYRLKQLDAAIIALQSASQCDPKMLDAHIALGEAYAEKGDDNRALAALENALKVKSGHEDALRATAKLYVRHQMNEQAIQTLEALVRTEQGDVPARASLGAVYAATGQIEKAEQEFQEALRLNPDYASALTGLGNVYLKRGQVERAIELLQKSAKLAPDAYEPHFLLGAAYNRLEQYEDAARELQQAARIGAEDPEIFYHLARAYQGLQREGERRQALAQFTALREKSEREKEAQREAGRLIERAKPLVDAGDLQGAIALLERARDLNSGDTRVLFRLAGLYYDAQQYAAARKYAQQATELAPSEWLYHYLLGLIDKSTGNWDRARASLETTIYLNPSAADAYNQLGELAMQQRDIERAMKYFKRAVQIDPQQPAYRRNLEAAQRAQP